MCSIWKHWRSKLALDQRYTKHVCVCQEHHLHLLFGTFDDVTNDLVAVFADHYSREHELLLDFVSAVSNQAAIAI